jgi:hypothetical protein
LIYYHKNALRYRTITICIEIYWLDTITADTDIFNEGISGDDFHELMDRYAKTYSIDMTNYLWYFHADEEGGWNSLGQLFFDPPYIKVSRIPVTPALLANFAQKGKWNIEYPEHDIPKRRYDILLNQILLIGFVVWFIIMSIRKC